MGHGGCPGAPNLEIRCRRNAEESMDSPARPISCAGSSSECSIWCRSPLRRPCAEARPGPTFDLAEEPCPLTGPKKARPVTSPAPSWRAIQKADCSMTSKRPDQE
jgi:hypothetical protein